MLRSQRLLRFNSITPRLQTTTPTSSSSSSSSFITYYTSKCGMSTHKEIAFGTEGRASLAKGVETLAKAVAVTLGPKGRNVLIEQPYGSPKITKDGVTVAKSISLENKFENLGARLVQDVASKTNETAGDGTTTATVLTHAIFNEGLKNVAAGCNPTDLRRGVQAAVEAVVKYLKQHSRNITSSAEIAQVATISANGDTHIGQLIAQAMEKVGKEGVITVQEGKTLEDQLEVTEGMRLDRGFISPYFITDPKSQKVEFEKPLVLLSEKKITLIQDILPALEIAAQARRPLFIIAEDIEGEAMSICILNKLRGQVQVCAIKAPGFGDNRKAMLEDLAVLTGGKVISEESGMKLDKLTMEDLGSAGTVTVTKEDTILLNGMGEKTKLNERCETIRLSIQSTTSEYEKEKLLERLAKLSGGVAVIKVGGASEVEVGEKKDRFVDALNATRAAVEEGIVPGGGIALLKSTQILHQVEVKNEDQKLGVQLVKKALQAPTKTIVDNAGESGSFVVGKLLDATQPEGTQFGIGYDAVHSKYTDMIQAGIVDPLKVVRTALVDAAGVASLLSTSECLVVDAPKKDMVGANGGAGAAGMGGGMGF